jgi:organic hydroperoxide reductase OsmC/OhrA
VLPRIVLGDAKQEADAARAMRETERDCFVSNSLKAEVAVEPFFEVAPPRV